VAQNKAKVVNFNADARAEERGKGNVFIGGKTFHPRKRTTRLMSEWADVLPNAEEIELARKAQDDDDPKGANEAAKRSMRENPVIANRQLSVLLQDDQGVQPDVDFLCEHLDIEDTGELLDLLSPQEEPAAVAGGGPGNA
jgi:hypothetical protein